MKRLLMAWASVGLFCAFGAFSMGCGNACDDAVDHLKECGSNVTAGDTSDCSGAAECWANCINDASCDDLKSANGSYIKCIAGCH